MFLSEKKKKDNTNGTNGTNGTKGLSSLKIDNLSSPSHLNPKDLLPATLQYRPTSSAPTRGATELTREDRHSAHLRKKRLLKKEMKRKEEKMRELAQKNKKIRMKLEKEDALKKLGKNRNVQIIGGKQSKKSF